MGERSLQTAECCRGTASALLVIVRFVCLCRCKVFLDLRRIQRFILALFAFATFRLRCLVPPVFLGLPVFVLWPLLVLLVTLRTRLNLLLAPLWCEVSATLADFAASSLLVTLASPGFEDTRNFFAFNAFFAFFSPVSVFSGDGCLYCDTV